MSDNKKIKAIRLPFPKSLLNKLKADDPWECEEYLEEKFGELWDKATNGFRIEFTSGRVYLDYLLSWEFSEGEWGFAWFLNDEDITKYKPLFDKGEFEYDPKNLRKVAYCYYDGYEPPDYYEPKDITFENI